MSTVFVPEYLPYLLGVLGLLLVWQFHHMQVVSGRIQAKSFWDRSGIRMFIHMTPDDDQTCTACQETSGTVWLPVHMTRKKPVPHGGCTNPAGCRCQLIALYGGWPEGARLLSQAMSAGKKPLKLTRDKLNAFIQGPWEKSPNAKADRMSMHMLGAISMERTDPNSAIQKYKLIVDQAKLTRDLPMVVPAALRLLDLLERSGRASEALVVIDRLEKHLNSDEAKPKESHAHKEMLSLRRTRLTAAAQQSF